MKRFDWLIILLLTAMPAKAEIVEADNSALAIFGTGCEEVKAGEQNASTRLKATDKASFNAVSTLPDIINIKDSFDDHDFNVMIYNIVDDYIEDMTVKTTKQDNTQICVEVSGYITPENIGKAIDNTIQTAPEEKKEAVSAVVEQNTAKQDMPAVSEPDDALTDISPTHELLQLPSSQPQSDNEPHIVVLSTIFVKPTEFYNHTQSGSHSKILKNILSQSERIKIVEDEDEANFVITPKVLKAKIEPLNNETSRMQMVIALETFDRNKNTTETEHQNKFVLFNNNDDEQSVAKTLLSQLFEQGSSSILKIAEKSSSQTYQKHRQNFLPEVITVMPPARQAATAGVGLSDKQPYSD